MASYGIIETQHGCVWPDCLAEARRRVEGRILPGLRRGSGLPADGKTPFLDIFEQHPDWPYPTCLAEAIVESWMQSQPDVSPDEMLVSSPRPRRPLREHFSRGITYDRWCLEDPAYIAQASAWRQRFEGVKDRLFPLTMEGYVVEEGVRRFGSKEAYQAIGAVMWPADYQGHTVPDYAKLLGLGIGGLVQEIAAWKGRHDSAESRTLLDACERVYRGMSKWIVMQAEFAEKLAAESNGDAAEWQRVADTCRFVAWNPPETLLQAAQLLWFYSMWDSVDSLGRSDQYLYPFYKNDLDAGRLTADGAYEIICALWLKFMEHGVHNVTLSGLTPDGADATNDLTYLCLDASQALRETHPRLTVRVHPDIPQRVLEQSVQMWSEGMADPTFVNDELVLKGLAEIGVPLQDARDYTCLGCQEIEIPGRGNWGCEDATFNLAKCLELALNDGKCRLTGCQIGPRTGDIAGFSCFEDVWNAYRKQTEFFAKHCIELSIRGEKIRSANLAKLVRMPLTADCLERGLDPDGGGARYGFGVIETAGIGAVADSLSALDKLVFREGVVSLRELNDALSTNFDQAETLRQTLLHHAPKYGNDDLDADRMAAKVAAHFWEYIGRFKSGRGGKYVGAISLLERGVILGKRTAAMPDGRKAGDPLGNSVGPRTGADTHGPTAMLKSAARIPQHMSIGGTTTNVKLPARLIQSPEQRNKILAMVRAYFAEGGQMVQVTPVDSQTLREAQQRPDLHHDLIVRVGGYSAKFVELSKEIQDEIIARN